MMKTAISSLKVSSFRRRLFLLRATTCVVILGQLLIAAPVLAADVTQAAIKSGGRLTADAKRRLAKATVRVNRTVPTVAPPSLEVSFGDNVTTDMIRHARLFDEPLIPIGSPGFEENRALGRMLEVISTLPRETQLNRIDAFLLDHTASPWKASLLSNAATLYAKEGYFSRAASYWEQAFLLTRDNAEPGPTAIADHVLGEWLSQMAMFGQLDRMGALFGQIGTRDVRGSAGAKVSAAREALTFLSEHHEMATFSGPEALRNYLSVTRKSLIASSIDAIDHYHPAPIGTTLVDLQELAHQTGTSLEMVHLAPIGDIPVPSIVHFKSQHYSAIIGRSGDRYVLRDPGIGGILTVSGDAIRAESTGYFMLPANVASQLGARIVASTEAATVIGHCAPGGPAGNDPPCPFCGGGGPGGPGGPGMPGYSLHPQKVSLLIDDVPVGYTPPVGPPIAFHLSYDHRENRNQATFDYGHVGPMWSHNWLSYVTEPMLVRLRGIGEEQHANAVAHPFSGAVLVQVSATPVRWERRLPDGTVEVFSFADRPAGQPNRRIFLTEIIDPQGHSVTLTYDSSVRLVAITDAIGQVTTLAYEDAADPLRITKVTDPFGRFATLAYDAAGRLITLTDAAGMSSSFTYGAGDFVVAMTTPYGITTFRHEPSFSDRMIEATDPAGGTERVEYHVTPGGMSSTLDTSEVPTGFSANNVDMQKYYVFYWDKVAMAAGATVANATITALTLGYTDYGGHNWARNIPHSVKRPLESRVWYKYEGATGRAMGASAQPIAVGRVLDGGASQIMQTTYNAQRMVTSRIDPASRQTNYTYASNGLDLLQVEQVRSGGSDVIQAYSNYNTQHLPGTITDAASQDTNITYNSAGQSLTVTNAKSETTTYTYDTNGYLQTVTGPVSGATTTYGYDAYGRVESVEDADGYAVVSDYDNLNRVIGRTYPDETTETFTFTKLSLSEQKDRLGRITHHFYDGFGRRVATRDPAGRTISQVWCTCGSLDAIVDANGNRTKWERDVQGRVTRELRADNTTDTLYTYDLVGNLKTITDPKDQVTTHTYNLDDSLGGTVYTNAEITTPSVSYTYDTYYPRLTAMVDGIGTTTYTYKVPAANGAGQVATIDGPLTNDTIAYIYDELGRVVQRTINGTANQVDLSFDALGRVTSETNALGEFIYTYEGVTNRLATVTYPNGQTSAYAYYSNSGDRRLQTIHHKYPNASTLWKFDYTYDEVGNILTWRQQADSTAVLWEYGYDAVNQLRSAVKHDTDVAQTILQRFAYAYDPAGNRTVEQIDDTVTLSAYDNLNRLTSLAPGGPMVIAGTLNETGTVTISGTPAIVDANNNFRGTVPTTAGTNAFTIVARDASGNSTTKQYEVDLLGSSKSFSYDANGNTVAAGSRVFAWNAKNELQSTQLGDSSTEWLYDGSGRRVQQLERTNATLTSSTSNIWLGDSIVQRVSSSLSTPTMHYGRGEYVNGVSRFVVTDHIGNTRAVSDGSSQILAKYEFSPYGERSKLSGAVEVSRGFSGTDLHLVTGLAFARARVYDSTIGRWITEDPFQSESTVDRSRLQQLPSGTYSYVRNNPLRWVDPSGLVTWQCEYSVDGASDGWAAGYYMALCTSECVNGKQVTASYAGSVVGGAAGPIPVTLIYSTTKIKDPFAIPNAANLQGFLTIASVGGAIGVGYSYTRITMGSGTTVGGWGWQYGIDGGVSSLAGASAVLGAWTKDCCK